MDAFQEQELELSGNDREARRLLELAVTFINAREHISSSQIRRYHYPDTSPDAFRKAFIRDRKKLALCGVIIVRANKQPDEPLWKIDDSASFANVDQISQREALALDIACASLAADPSYPYGNDLRMALAKIDRVYSSSAVNVSARSRSRSVLLNDIEKCHSHGYPAKISYQKASGEVISRCVGILGLFSLRDRTYFVAETLDDTTLEGSSHIRSYRVDRLRSIKILIKPTYVIPPDFDIRDYICLPFQIGVQDFDATFVVPIAEYEHLSAVLHTYGDVVEEAGTYRWRINVCDVQSAARWAISEGIRPVHPAILVDAWRSILEDVTSDGR